MKINLTKKEIKELKETVKKAEEVSNRLKVLLNLIQRR